MRLLDITTPIDDLTEEELIARLKEIRRRREVEKPSTAKRVRAKVDKEAKVNKLSLNRIDSILSNLSKTELDELLQSLEN
jgi:hypothetical protein